jgi:hypothetical protein
MQLANEKIGKRNYHRKWYEGRGLISVFRPTKERFDKLQITVAKTQDELLNDMIDCYIEKKKVSDGN